MTKKDIIITIPDDLRATYTQLYNNLQFKNIFFYFNNDYCNLLSCFFSSQKYQHYIDIFNKQLNQFKLTLQNLNGHLYHDNKIININDIQSVWIPSNYFSNFQSYSNIIQYFIKINDIFIDSSRFYFSGKKKDTQQINELGFLNKFQYDILYNNKNNDQYLKILKMHYESNPYLLNDNYLLELQLYAIEYIWERNINIIKKYWLCSKLTKDNLYKINNIQSKFLLKELSN